MLSGSSDRAATLQPHPDRLAPTLAARAALPKDALVGPFAVPGPGSDDARVDLKLLAHRARRAVAERGTEAARQRLLEVAGADLLAGTVQDGTARGVMVALEEALSLCEPPAPPPDVEPDDDAAVYEGRELRRKRDILVASGGARVRFSRKGGLLLVDRAHDLHIEDCVGFEDRSDAGTLDGFEPVDGERPRLFSPGFLQPVLLSQGRARNVLIAEGRLGRRNHGYPCRLRLEGRRNEERVRLTIAILNRLEDHRLRIRFRSLPETARIGHEGTPGWEIVEARGRRFVAATLVRACGRLRIGNTTVPVPAAQCPGWIEHEFRLGGGAEVDAEPGGR